MFKFVGQNTKKVYARGKTKAECFRKMNERYPYKSRQYEGIDQKHGTLSNSVYSEPMLVMKE